MNNNNDFYNWETREFISFISSYEPLYLIVKDFIITYRKENEVHQLDIEFGLLGHAFIEHAKRLIAKMNVSNESGYYRYVKDWDAMLKSVKDLSLVDKPEVSEYLMEFIE
tara:strand:+ start:1036 stop:1365 length:330 start_codon:yes stop_codon:yes gene_type:complete